MKSLQRKKNGGKGKSPAAMVPISTGFVVRL
jgi:hypothetical protein